MATLPQYRSLPTTHINTYEATCAAAAGFSEFHTRTFSCLCTYSLLYFASVFFCFVFFKELCKILNKICKSSKLADVPTNTLLSTRWRRQRATAALSSVASTLACGKFLIVVLFATLRCVDNLLAS